MIYDIIKDKYPILWSHIERDEDGSRFHNQVGEFIRRLKPTIVVETGVRLGLSSDRILRALTNARSKLYSCDPDIERFTPQPETTPIHVKHPRWRTWVEKSVAALPEIFQETGPWDVFLHDSDHEIWCQTFEYEFAWNCLRPGGWLLSDDYTWGSPEHHAWRDFCKREEIPQGMYIKLGSCMGVQKPIWFSAPSVYNLTAIYHRAFELADRAEKDYVGRRRRA